MDKRGLDLALILQLDWYAAQFDQQRWRIPVKLGMAYNGKGYLHLVDQANLSKVSCAWLENAASYDYAQAALESTA